MRAYIQILEATSGQHCHHSIGALDDFALASPGNGRYRQDRSELCKTPSFQAMVFWSSITPSLSMGRARLWDSRTAQSA
jgi:hypothetical protein